MGNALFEPILQCVPRYTATRLVNIIIAVVVIVVVYAYMTQRMFFFNK